MFYDKNINPLIVKVKQQLSNVIEPINLRVISRSHLKLDNKLNPIQCTQWLSVLTLVH